MTTSQIYLPSANNGGPLTNTPSHNSQGQDQVQSRQSRSNLKNTFPTVGTSVARSTSVKASREGGKDIFHRL